MLELQALKIQPEAIQPDRDPLSTPGEKQEILNVLEGIGKYAPEHVLLTGRPGSGKSTALLQLLLEHPQSFLT